VKEKVVQSGRLAMVFLTCQAYFDHSFHAVIQRHISYLVCTRGFPWDLDMALLANGCGIQREKTRAGFFCERCSLQRINRANKITVTCDARGLYYEYAPTSPPTTDITLVHI
jgi:hypothetical protein